jgi:hypothetical protein
MAAVDGCLSLPRFSGRARLAHRRGFRFEFSYLSKQGLAIGGFAVGAIIDRRLYLIIYSGAREYYFPKHRDDVEQIVSSVRFI